MNNSVNSRKNAARSELQQLKLNAGLIADKFPEVATIVIKMMHSQRSKQTSFRRVVNFHPGSHAFFRISCLNKECVDGGFDLSQIISGMIEGRRAASKGILNCDGGGNSAEHAAVSYEVAIKYA